MNSESDLSKRPKIESPICDEDDGLGAQVNWLPDALPQPPVSSSSPTTTTPSSATRKRHFQWPPERTFVYPPQRNHCFSNRSLDAVTAHAELLKILYHQSALTREYLELQQQLEDRRRRYARVRRSRRAAPPPPLQLDPLIEEQEVHRQPPCLPVLSPKGQEEFQRLFREALNSIPTPTSHVLFPGTGLTPTTSSHPDLSF